MQPKDSTPDRSGAGEAPKNAPPRRFDATLPMGKPGENAPRNGEGELDLDLGDIQTRLPYGSEDIADK
jgi:hypothetical protein